MKRCKHPKGSQHDVGWGVAEEGYVVITRWCDRCGALWERCGWEGQTSKWRKPEAGARP